jgi:hypothetical protein
MAEWRREGTNADVFAVLCDDDSLDPAQLTPAPIAKETKPMTQKQYHDDAFADELSDLLGRMSASDSRTLRKFLEAVSERLDEVRKDASSDFLAQLRAYMLDYFAQLGAIPSGGSSKTDPPPSKQFPAGDRKATLPHPTDVPPVIKALAQRLLKGAIAQRNNLIVAVQDDRGLLHNPARDARESAAAFDMKGEPMRKTDDTTRTSVTEVEQEDLTTNPCASAQAERDRVAAQRQRKS